MTDMRPEQHLSYSVDLCTTDEITWQSGFASDATVKRGCGALLHRIEQEE